MCGRPSPHPRYIAGLRDLDPRCLIEQVAPVLAQLHEHRSEEHGRLLRSPRGEAVGELREQDAGAVAALDRERGVLLQFGHLALLLRGLAAASFTHRGQRLPRGSSNGPSTTASPWSTRPLFGGSSTSIVCSSNHSVFR